MVFCCPMVVLDIIGLYSCGIESQDGAIKSNNGGFDSYRNI